MRQLAIGKESVTGSGNNRLSQPYEYPYGVIPRRLIGERSLGKGSEEFWRYSRDNPLRLLSLLPEIHPSVGLALWNALRLTCGEGDTQIIAVEIGTEKQGEKVDVEGTAAIEALWESLPEEIGGLIGLMTQLTQQALLTGLVCTEAVPGRRMEGVYRVWPVDSLTVYFHRDFKTTEVMPLQRQLFIKKPKETYQGYAVLSRDTFFWRSIDQQVDEPYGRAPYAVAAFECLADLAMIQDLRDAIHNGAWPRAALGQNFKELYEIATKTMGLRDLEGDYAATRWVNQRVSDTMTKLGELKASDNISYDAAGDLKILESKGAFQALQPAIEYLRQRIVQTLKTLPTLMGINDGSTQTYTTVEWAIYAAGLESIRNIVVAVLTRAAQLHLRLLGKNLKAIAKVKPIRTTDGMIEAQAEGLRIGNEKQKVMLGWVSNEEASIAITGSGPVAEPMPGAYGLPPEEDPDAEPNADPNGEGKDAKQSAEGGKDGKKKPKKSKDNGSPNDPAEEDEDGTKP